MKCSSKVEEETASQPVKTESTNLKHHGLRTVAS